MLIPVGSQSFIQQFMAIDKINGELKKTYISPVRYVPLTDLDKQIHKFWFNQLFYFLNIFSNEFFKIVQHKIKNNKNTFVNFF